MKNKAIISNKENINEDSAMSWWLSLSFEEKFYKTIEWLKKENRNTTERHPNELTVFEILVIYKDNI